MNKSQTRADRISDWPMVQKVLLVLAIVFAILSLGFLFCPFNEGLSAWSMAIAGGLLAAAVLLPTMRRADAAEKAIVQKTFSDAITHLGHESESVILGSIHSLLDLAKENEDYRPMVFNILCAHIKTTTEGEYCKKYKEEPSTSIQVLLRLLFIDEKYNIFPVDPVDPADLSGAYLAGSKLSGARLQGANLSRAQLRGAFLIETKLKQANLLKAQLKEANLLKAHLQGADLRSAQLRGAILSEAQLQSAFLSEAQLQKADLSEAQLQGADLRSAQLQGADLRSAQLQEKANLWRAQLQGANLRGANLHEANLTEAQLQGADLMGAQLQGARLQQTEMQAAFMYRTQLPHKTQMGRSNLRGVSSRNPNKKVIKLKELEELEFKKRIESRKGKKADLKGVKFDKVNPDLATSQNEGTAQTGFYTKKKADQWIKEYEEALDGENHQD